METSSNNKEKLQALHKQRKEL